MTIDFKRPARMDDLLAVETSVEEVGSGLARAGAENLARRGASGRARVTVGAVEGGAARRLPREVREKFLRIQNA